MILFIEFLLSFLAARLIWDAVKHYSRRADMLPLWWTLQVGAMVAYLVVFGFGLVLTIAYLLSNPRF
jgi:hypothetical protein